MQSITHLVFLKYLKHFGEFSLICSLVGHLIRKLKSMFIRHTHVVNIRQTELSETPNISPKDLVSNPLRNRNRVRVNSSFSDSKRFGPLLGICKFIILIYIWIGNMLKILKIYRFLLSLTMTGSQSFFPLPLNPNAHLFLNCSSKPLRML